MKLKNHDFCTRLVRTRPLLSAALIFLLGCILGYALLPSEILAGCVSIALITAAAALRKRARRISAVLLLLAMLPLGVLRFEAAWQASAPLADQTGAQLSGRICRTPEWNADTERTICVLEDFSIDGASVKGRIRLYLRGDAEQLQAVRLGQQISCSAHIWRAEGASNPGQFDFSNYLRLRGLRGYATAVIEESHLDAPVLKPGDFPERMRAATAARIGRLFPENAALARAFILGDRSELSSDERKSYSNSGAAHLLAISGMHVSILAAAISLLLGRFMRRKASFGITLALLFAYGALIGFSASLFRAIIMFAVFGFAPLAGRYSDAPTRLGASMLIYLLMRPMAILDAGFILSYSASAGIILLYKPLQRLFRAENYLSKHTGVGFVSLFVNRIPRWILRSLFATAAAQLAIAPAVVHFYGTLPLYSFAVNLVAVPIAMAAYIISILAALTGLLPAAWAADTLFGLLTRCVTFFGNLPLSALHIARFPLWLLVFCAFSCLFASDLSKLPLRLRGMLPFAIIPAMLVSNYCAQLTTRDCSIVFLDAGQADCAVIRTQGSVYLIDTGDGYTPAADYLSAMNYTVDGVFLSHSHTDHAGGLGSILDVCTPAQIYISANWSDFETDEEVAASLERAASMGSEIISVSAGERIRLSDKTLLEVLSPAAGFSTDSANEDSLILRLNYGKFSALFPGDAPTSVYSDLAGDIDLLKAAHHGARDALDASLLAELSPSVAVIPTGYNNYGHPDAQTLELLEAAHAAVYRTDAHGAITCRLHEDGSIDVQTHHASEVANGLE